MSKFRSRNGLTEQEEVFLMEYTTNGFNRAEAVRKAGWRTKDPSGRGAEVLNRPQVIKALGELLEKRRAKFFVAEQDILEGLYREANRDKEEGGTQQGRIQAWTQLGKAIGMFDQKVKDLEKQAKLAAGGGQQITIINYNSPQQEKTIKDIEDEAKDALDGIEYREEDDTDE